MTEQEAAVAWLEKDYDQALTLCTRQDEHPDWGPYVRFSAREIQRRSNGRLMFTIKDQNG